MPSLYFYYTVLYCIIGSGINLFISYVPQASVALQSITWQIDYPMDFYANDSLGPWTPKNQIHRFSKLSAKKPKKSETEKAKETAIGTQSFKNSQGGCTSEAAGECCGDCSQSESSKKTYALRKDTEDKSSATSYGIALDANFE